MAALQHIDCASHFEVICELAEDVFHLVVWNTNQDVIGPSRKPYRMLLVTRYLLDTVLLVTTL